MAGKCQSAKLFRIPYHVKRISERTGMDKKELFAKYCSPQEIPTNNNIVKKIVEGFKRIIGVKL